MHLPLEELDVSSTQIWPPMWPYMQPALSIPSLLEASSTSGKTILVPSPNPAHCCSLAYEVCSRPKVLAPNYGRRNGHRGGGGGPPDMQGNAGCGE
jgi:hypothetical protein